MKQLFSAVFLITATVVTVAAETLRFPDTVTLDNGLIRVGISAAAGRIVDFGVSGGGPNLLWLNTVSEVRELRETNRWVNLGGDRVWPELYNYWRSIRRTNIPDPRIDGGEWIPGEQTKLAMTIRSRVSESLGCRLERRIELSPDRPCLTVTNRIVQIEPTPFPLQLWPITQIQPADCYFFAIAPGEPPYRISSDEAGEITLQPGRLIYLAPRDTTTKLTGNGEWLAARFGELLFVQASHHTPGACYPEGGSQMLFTGPRYAELEFSGGLRHLKPGEIFENSVQWELVQLPRNTGNGDAARTAQDTATKLLQGNRDHE